MNTFGPVNYYWYLPAWFVANINSATNDESAVLLKMYLFLTLDLRMTWIKQIKWTQMYYLQVQWWNEWRGHIVKKYLWTIVEIIWFTPKRNELLLNKKWNSRSSQCYTESAGEFRALAVTRSDIQNKRRVEQREKVKDEWWKAKTLAQTLFGGQPSTLTLDLGCKSGNDLGERIRVWMVVSAHTKLEDKSGRNFTQPGMHFI